MDEQVDRLFAKERIFAQLSGCFGLLAVALAGVACMGSFPVQWFAGRGRLGAHGPRSDAWPGVADDPA